MVVRTSGGHEDLYGRVLQQVTSGEDGADLVEVPLSVQVVHVRHYLLQDTNRESNKYTAYLDIYS